MPLDNLASMMLPAIEEELKLAILPAKNTKDVGIYEMLAYHMGWEDVLNPKGGNKGKRVRPLLVTLCNKSAGGIWQDSLPAAAAVELLHNFSLIHDDIEDNSILRRGKPTLWNKWNIPLAINAGDAMFTLAHLCILRLKNYSSLETSLAAANLLHKACLHLTIGQHMDITFEQETTPSVDLYWSMIEGKTASLLAVCSELGALIANTDQEIQLAYRNFGYSLGLAFQVQDDLLGIWGDTVQTGKSNENDLVTRKKTFPILYGLSLKGNFAERWFNGQITPEEVKEISNQLESEGAREYTQEICNQLTQEALISLESASPKGEASQALKLLANRLLRREF